MDDSPTRSSPSTIHVTKRTERSASEFMLHHLMKPFASRIGQPKGVFEAGSPRLDPDKSAKKHCDIHERVVEDIYVYDVVPKRSTSSGNGDYTARKGTQLYYIAGGTWQMPPSSDHWKFCAELASQLWPISMSVISCPLAPESPAPAAFPQLMKMYKHLLDDAEADGEKVILAGDSSGGNIVLGLAIAHLNDNPDAPCPTALMAICPSVDMRKRNPDMQEIEKHDPLLRIAASTEGGNKWRRDWSASDPRVTPLLADLSILARRGVQVHGVTGGYDILTPDALLFRSKCDEAGVKGEWLEYDKQMHCFPLAFTYKLPAAIEGVDWIVDVLQRS